MFTYLLHMLINFVKAFQIVYDGFKCWLMFIQSAFKLVSV